jgi:hypothetical protein
MKKLFRILYFNKSKYSLLTSVENFLFIYLLFILWGRIERHGGEEAAVRFKEPPEPRSKNKNSGEQILVLGHIYLSDR